MTATLNAPATTTPPAPGATTRAPESGPDGLVGTIALSFLPEQSWAPGLVRRLPILLVMLAQAVYAVTQLNQLAWGDEGLYAYAGHKEVAHLLHGSNVSHFVFGSYFSGAPDLYPVVSGLLDGLGGLALTRAFSTLCMCGVTFCVYVMTQRMFGRGEAIAASVVYASASSTVYLSHLATYDAPALFLLMFAATVMTARGSYRSYAAAGLALALAVGVKYAAALWVPSILLLPLTFHRRAVDVRKVATAALVMLGLLGLGLGLYAHQIWDGIDTTTVERTVLALTPRPFLVERVAQEVGVALVLILAGLILCWRHRRYRLAATLLFLTALLAPLHQLQIREETSLIKHSDFGVALAAPLIGYAVVTLVRRTNILLVAALVAAACWVTVAYGGTYSHYAASTGTELTAVFEHVQAGDEIMSSEATSTQYYYDIGRFTPAGHRPRTSSETWLFPGLKQIQAGQPDVLALNNSPTGSPGKDAARRAQIAAAMASPDYLLVSDSEQVTDDPTYRWYVWVRE